MSISKHEQQRMKGLARRVGRHGGIQLDWRSCPSWVKLTLIFLPPPHC